MVGTGLRPEEAFGLHRTDVDKTESDLRVRRRFSGGEVKPGTKTVPERVVPLRQRVIDVLEAMPPRIDTPILLPAPRGGYIDIERFRHREWRPALRAAGIDHRRIYDCRHTFATGAIESGVQASHLAVVMGTSIRELEDTYYRWLRRTDDRLRAAFRLRRESEIRDELSGQSNAKPASSRRPPPTPMSIRPLSVRHSSASGTSERSR